MDKPIIFMGDLNLGRNRFNDKEYHLKELAKALQNTAASCDLTTQKIGNTFVSNRRTKNGLETIQSAIDHIFYSKEKLRARCLSVANGLSDHLPVVIKIRGTRNATTSWKTVKKRTYKNFDKEGFIEDLWYHLWECLGCTEDMNEMIGAMEVFIAQSLDKLAPVKTFKISSNYRQGLSDETKCLLIERDRMRKLAGKSTDPDRIIYYEQYRKLRNKCVGLVRKGSRRATLALFQDKEGGRNVWKAVNSMTRRKGTENITLRMAGEDINDAESVSEEFNKFFIAKIRG